ncbi:MAG: elongation factor Tu [Clostridia bacterium]|nr:elongation factor Tu [Clostridia bacterium]
MEYIFAAQNDAEFNYFHLFVKQYEGVLSNFIGLLKSKYKVQSLPRCIVLTSARTATELISDIPIPAYTNDYRVVFVPQLDTWKNTYLRQLDSYENSADVKEIRSYYEAKLNDRHLLQIIGHELTHHSELFSDEIYENGGAWFEEGLVEYISRKYFLSASEFEDEVRINKKLVELYEQSHPQRPIALFGDSKDYATIYYDYWRAFIKIMEAVDHCGGDELTVLLRYAKNPSLLLSDK